MRIKTMFALAVTFIFSIGFPQLVKAANVVASNAYSHPWIVRSNSFFMISFHLKATDIKQFLPEGVKPSLNEHGLVNVTFEMYETEKISGLSPYKAAFIVIDIAGHPSRKGVPGHFAIWGRVDTPAVLDFFKQEFGFPYQLAKQLDVTTSPAQFSGVISSEKGELLKVSIEPLKDQPFAGDGIVDMVSVRPGLGLVKAEVPYLTNGHFGKVTYLKINPQGDPLLTLLKDAQPAWSLVADDQTFSYSHVISIR